VNLPDLLTAINGNLPDATRYGDPAAVEDLTKAVDALQDALAPLVEVLSHPENRELFKARRQDIDMLGLVHVMPHYQPLVDLFDALESL